MSSREECGIPAVKSLGMFLSQSLSDLPRRITGIMNQPCTVLISSDGKLSSIDIATLRADLESKDIQKKRNAVKSAIIQMSNGKDMSELLMTVIRFCVTVDDHELTKLLHM